MLVVHCLVIYMYKHALELRQVRQGETRRPSLLSLMVFEILCISIRNNKHMHGIVIDKQRNYIWPVCWWPDRLFEKWFFLTNFLKIIEDYGICSGLDINHEKSEILLLGNRAYIVPESNVIPDNIHSIKVKKSV